MERKMMENTRERDKPIDLRLIVPRDLARTLRQRARQSRRTLQAQALVDLEQGMGATMALTKYTRE